MKYVLFLIVSASSFSVWAQTPNCRIESLGGAPEQFQMNIYPYGTSIVIPAANDSFEGMVNLATQKIKSSECAYVILTGDKTSDETPYYAITKLGSLYSLNYSWRTKSLFTGTQGEVEKLAKLIESAGDLAGAGVLR